MLIDLSTMLINGMKKSNMIYALTNHLPPKKMGNIVLMSSFKWKALLPAATHSKKPTNSQNATVITKSITFLILTLVWFREKNPVSRTNRFTPQIERDS